MQYSKFNIFSKVRNSENYFIINLLTGSADILGTEEANKLKAIIRGDASSEDALYGEMIEKGYLSDKSIENKLYRSKYLDFLDSRSKDEIQIFFVTNYSCNFACTYCYQDQYSNPGQELDNDVIDSFSITS